MSQQRSNIEDAIARLRGVGEADALDWLEADARERGDAPPGSSLRAIDEAIRGEPGLATALEQMRIDRAALGSLDVPQPPASVAQAVLDEHERQSLLVLAGRGSPVGVSHADPPLSLASFPGWFKPAMGIAAVLLVAFAAWQLLPVLLRSGPPPLSPGDPIAIAGGDAGSDDPVDESPEDEQRMAARDGDADAPPREVVFLTPTDTVAAAPEPAWAEVLAARVGMPAEDVLDHAMDGRLVVVVLTDDLAASRRAAEDASVGLIDPAWRMRDAGGELIAAMSGPGRAVFRPIDGGFGHADGGLVGDLERVVRSTPTVFVAEAACSPEAMLRMLDQVGRLGDGVRIAIAGDPLPGAGSMPPPAIESTLFWWEEDPASWQPWAGVAVQFVPTR
ncbi:MAG: hypothetical protein AAFX79_04100 [Planctomycetota bacterium]